MIISRRSHLNKVENEKHLLPLIEEFCSSEPLLLAQKLNSNLKWNLPQGNLLHWVRVLNLFDDIFERQIDKYGLAAQNTPLRPMAEEDAELIVACLKFTKMLMDHCTSRSIYSSLERVFLLINTPCIDVKLAALEVALCLGERYVYGSQHKKFMAPKPVRLRLLETAKLFPPPIPASFIQSRVELADKSLKKTTLTPKKDHYSWVDTLDPKQKYPSKWKLLNFEYYRLKPFPEKDAHKDKKHKDMKPTVKKSTDKKHKDKQKSASSDLSTSPVYGEGLASFGVSEEHVRKLSLEQIYERATEQLPDYTWFLFSFAAHNAKAFNTKAPEAMDLRRKLLRVKCLAIACVACFCSSDFTASQLFELEPYTVGFLMDLVSPANTAFVTSDVFYSALKTIRAIAMKRVWGSEIVRHLGGNVNHGLLYEVLRHINKQARLEEENPYEDGQKVFLTTLGDLVESKTLAPRLVAGGILTELMVFMDIRGEHRWAVSAAVHIISSLLSSSPEFVGDFADNDGFALLINAINFEVDFALGNPGYAGGAPSLIPVHHTISLKQVKYLRNLLDFVSALILSDAGDRLRNLFDSPILSSFNKIIVNPQVFGPQILATTVDNVAQIIHNEPTAFSILNEAGIISNILENYRSLFMPFGELLLSLLEVLGAISLNKDGLLKVMESDVIHTFFLSFYELDLAKESMRSDMSTNIGCSMDELGRHNPALRPYIMEEIKKLIMHFAEYANDKLTPISFYSSDAGNMYMQPTEKIISKEDGQEEIESWEGMFASNLVDNVFGFLNGLLQDTGQWGKDVVKDIPFEQWETFLTMPNTSFDFTVSNCVVNLIAVLKYLDDEVPSYGLLHILATISRRLNSREVQSFLKHDEKVSYFQQYGKDSSEASGLLSQLNILNNLFFILTEIHFTPNLISNETNMVFFEYLQNDLELVEKIVTFLQATAMEETNIRSALPDEVMERTSPSIFYTSKTSAIRIFSKKPSSDIQLDESTSAKFKNTLQLRFLMDSLLNNLTVTLSTIAKSCMHRRQDFFTDAWRRSSVAATKQLAVSLNQILQDRRALSESCHLEYFLRIVHAISFVSIYKDRGKETVSTSFLLFFYFTTDLGKNIADNTVSVFNQLCSFSKEELESTKEITFIQNTLPCIGVNALHISLSFLDRVLAMVNMNKFPFMTYFFNKRYCDNDNYPLSGIFTQTSIHVTRLLSSIIGTESRFCKEKDYSLIQAFPRKIVEQLVDMVEHAWSVQPVDNYYPLREDWMTPAYAEVKYLKSFLGMGEEVASQLLSYAKSITNLDVLSEKALSMNLPDWSAQKAKLEQVDLDKMFQYDHIHADGARIDCHLKEREKDQIFVFALIHIASYFSKIQRNIVSAYSVMGQTLVPMMYVIDAIEELTSGEPEHQRCANLIDVLEGLVCYVQYDAGKQDEYQESFNSFILTFLSRLTYFSNIVDLDYCAAGLSLMLPLVSQTVPREFLNRPPYYNVTISPKLRFRFATTILKLEASSNVRSTILLGRHLYLLAKEDAYKPLVLNSPLLKSLIRAMKRLLEVATREEHETLQDSVVLAVRTCFENKSYLNDVFSAEITRVMKKHSGLKRELGQVIHEVRPIIGRDPQYFLEVASKLIRLDGYDGNPSSNERVFLLADEESPEKSKLDSAGSDIEMKDSVQRDSGLNPLGLVSFLLAELMNVAKEDWYSSPESAKSEEKAKTREKKKEDTDFDVLMENKKFAYVTFLLQSLCELVGSYNSAKLEFITFTKRAKHEETNKPRLTSLNFFIHQLIPSQIFSILSGPEFQRRESVSTLAKLTLLALVSTTVQENDAEPDPRKEDPDMAIVRKLMVDILSKILRETVRETSNITRVYSKVYDVFDLCSCLLSSKFRALCAPLLSSSVTKSDQFYIASAFIDSNLANKIATVISNIDLNFPDVSKVFNIGLKALSSLAKLKLAHVDLFESTSSGDKEDEDIEEDDERDETPDLFRNSTLGMYDIDLESDEEEDFYQDQSLVASSGSEMSEDESDDSDEMSYSDMESGVGDGELDEDEVEEVVENEAFQGFDSDNSESHVNFIEDLEIGSADGSDYDDSDIEEAMSDGEDFEEDADEGENEYTEAELENWEELFADTSELDELNGRARFGELLGGEEDDETRSAFDSESNSFPELEDDTGVEVIGRHSGASRDPIASFFNAIRPMGLPILSLNPSGILAGTIHIGSTRGHDTSFPQLDAAFQALLNSDHARNQTSHMLLKSSIERWSEVYGIYYRRTDTTFLEAARTKLKQLISADSYAIFQKKAEEKERLRKKRQEALEKKREKALLQREAERREREEAQEAQTPGPSEPVMLWIGNRQVDISGTDIDPEFFEALPEDMREEVFTQHVRERRANAGNSGSDVREIDPDFLQALPEPIRNEILQQESMSRRFSAAGFGLADEDEDEEFDSELEDDVEGDDEQDVTVGDEGDDHAESEGGSGSSEDKKKKQSFAVPLLDRAGVASLVKLLFLPRPINQREQFYQTLVLICRNKQTRSDVVSMIIAILHDGLTSQKALEKMFAQLSARATRSDEQAVCTSFPIGCSPTSIGVQFIEALMYLLEKVPSLRLYLLTEHENVYLTKKHLKKLKLKKASHCDGKFPINLLVKLLENPLLCEEYLFIDLLSNVLNYATKPLLLMRGKDKAMPATFSTNFIPDKNLRLIIKILSSNDCVNSTFRSTISTMHHLCLLQNAQNVFSTELSEKASELGDLIIKDLILLTKELADSEQADAHESKIVSKFTASSSDQAKLLRVLTALDYMHESKKGDKEATDVRKEQEKLTSLYKHLQLGALWKALSDCLRVLEENPELSHVATALLPLIEALMVVCKHSKVKEVPIKDVMKFEVKKIDFTNEPIESLFFSFTDEHKKILNQMVRSNPNLMSGPFSMLVLNLRVLEFDNKRNYFNRQLHNEKEPSPKMSVSIRRDQVFLDSYRALFFKSVEEFKKAHLEINFKGEAGIDAGGVTREWYQVLSRQMFNPDYALFTAVASDENTYHPNRTSYINPEHLSFFKFIGRTIGKAIYDGCFLDCHFSRAVYKKILDRSVSLKDMENLDLEYYKSLIWMLENDITDIITEDFSVETDDYGEHKIIDLVPNGRNIPVTEENKQEYVRLVVEYRLQTSVSEQMSNFITGFHEIIPRDLVAIFDEQELELLISGLPDIDVQDWQNNTNYSNYSASSEQIQWFWRAVKSFDNEERAKLLQFSTGTSKVPLNGFKDLRGANGVCKFSIHRDYGAKDRLPSSHTCFNQIDLPVYESYETLRGSLLLALSEGHEGFQLA